MTEDERPTPNGSNSRPGGGVDPGQFRSLHAVNPPDQWSDIVDRAGREPALPLVGPTGERSRRPLLAAAAVILVLALLGAFAAPWDGDDATTEISTAPNLDLDPPEDILGRVWNLTSLTMARPPIDIVIDSDGARIDGTAGPTRTPVNLDLSRDGVVSFTACNTGSRNGRIEGDVLVVGDEGGSTVKGCVGKEGEELMALDEAMTGFLGSDPTIELVGDELTLRSGDDIATFVARTPPQGQRARSRTVTRPVPPDSSPRGTEAA